MSIQLDSAKYFPTEFANPSEPNAMPQPGQMVGQPPQENVPTWTGSLTAVVWFCGIMGTVGVFGGLYQMYNVYCIGNSVEILTAMGTAEQVLAAKAALQSQLDYQWLLYLVAGFRMLIGAGFLFAVSAINTNKEQSNVLLALICLGAIVYNLVVFGTAWFTMPDFEALGMQTALAEGAVAMVMIFAGVVLVVKMFLHLGIVMFMMNKNNKALFGLRPQTASY